MYYPTAPAAVLRSDWRTASRPATGARSRPAPARTCATTGASVTRTVHGGSVGRKFFRRADARRDRHHRRRADLARRDELSARPFRQRPDLRPPGVALREVSFPGAVEPPRREWFIAETQPAGTPTKLDHSSQQILSPAAGTIIALDPDIPAAAQRVVFEASRGARDSHWILDGRALAPVRGELLWTPSPGAHTLAIVRDSGGALQTIQFVVRGSNVPQ